MTIERAMRLSAQENRIVEVPYSAEALADLICASDDFCQDGSDVEAWGYYVARDGESCEWRVRMVGVPTRKGV